MSVTFFAIDHQGAIMKDLEPYELNVANGQAMGIETVLGFRPEGDRDVPGGERTVDAFQTALMLAAHNGGGMGWWGDRLAQLAVAAQQAGADVIAWA